MTESPNINRGPVVLFDGVCNLCNSAVRLLIKIDRKKKFRFSPLQGNFAAQIKGPSLPGGMTGDSILLFHNGNLYTHSDAVLKICDLLGGGWKLLYPLRFIPRVLRDGVYRIIARNRYRWFGKKETCMVPDDALRSRFLD
jgi:predicted DCC family thiol-disulfide oxidoreductase YuxK